MVQMPMTSLFSWRQIPDFSQRQAKLYQISYTTPTKKKKKKL